MIRAGECSGFDGRIGLARHRVFLGTSAAFIHCKRSDDSLPPPVHVRRHGHARRLNHVDGLDEDARPELAHLCRLVHGGPVCLSRRNEILHAREGRSPPYSPLAQRWVTAG
jgi:hypothetical protein